MVTFTGWLSSDDVSHTNLNTHQQEYEDAVNNVLDGSEALTTPTINSFTNATHDHSNAANGGQIGVSGIDSGAATDGQVLTADGAGGAAFEDNNNTFKGLSDTPSGYTGKAHNLLRVNNAETAVVFVPIASCFVQRTTTQSISESTVTAIQFTGTDVFDPDDMHDPSTNPDRITIPQTGIYLVTCQMVWAVSGSGNSTDARLEIWHYDNSAATEYRVKLVPTSVSNANEGTFDITGQVYIDDTNDYIRIKVYQTGTGNAVNLSPKVTSPDDYSIKAEVTLLRAHP